MGWGKKNDAGQEGCPGCGRVGGKHSSTCRHRGGGALDRVKAQNAANLRANAEKWIGRRGPQTTYTPSPYPGVKMVTDYVTVRGHREKVYVYELDEAWLRQHGG